MLQYYSDNNNYTMMVKSAGGMSEKELKKLQRRIRFSLFVDSLKQPCKDEEPLTWECCQTIFTEKSSIHSHVSKSHLNLITKGMSSLRCEPNDGVVKENDVDEQLTQHFEQTLLDLTSCCGCSCEGTDFVVLLFYHYVIISETVSLNQLKLWQEQLMEALSLTGKIRLSKEGINGTVEGCFCATNRYQEAILQHPTFSSMSRDDFKKSRGEGDSFSEARVSICDELCTLGIPPDQLRADDGGQFVSPEDFHQILCDMKRSEGVRHDEMGNPPLLLLDVRNFYESAIGKFESAVAPDIRKFSYFPAYVERNRAMFAGRRVVTYCTGGIRCERATAYLKRHTDCAQVLQLKGGIHKYLDRYGRSRDHHFRGKLFVFDQRFAIANDSPHSQPIARCRYCSRAHDEYGVCSTPRCRQYVLICARCRRDDGLTACCSQCALSGEDADERCACTTGRISAPVETPLAS